MCTESLLRDTSEGKLPTVPTTQLPDWSLGANGDKKKQPRSEVKCLLNMESIY